MFICTPLELSRRFKAFHSREQSAWKRIAHLGHWVFVAWRGTKDSPTPDELLGKTPAPDDAERQLVEWIDGKPDNVTEFDRALKRQAERRQRGPNP